MRKKTIIRKIKAYLSKVWTATDRLLNAIAGGNINERLTARIMKRLQ